MSDIDMDLVKIYNNDGLWMDNRYYLSFIEESILLAYQGKLDSEIMKALLIWKRDRKNSSLTKTFAEDGTVSVVLEEQVTSKGVITWVRNLLSLPRTLTQRWRK